MTNEILDNVSWIQCLQGDIKVCSSWYWRYNVHLQDHQRTWEHLNNPATGISHRVVGVRCCQYLIPNLPRESSQNCVHTCRKYRFPFRQIFGLIYDNMLVSAFMIVLKLHWVSYLWWHFGQKPNYWHPLPRTRQLLAKISCTSGVGLPGSRSRCCRSERLTTCKSQSEWFIFSERPEA